MKKIFLVISIISVLFLSGCNTNKDVNNDVLNNDDNQNQENIINSGENILNEKNEEDYNITKELDKTQFLFASNLITNNDGTYTIQGELGTVYMWTQNEVNDIVKNGTITLNNNKLYNIRKNENKLHTEDYEYAIFEEDNESETPDYYIFKYGEEIYELCDKYGFAFFEKTGVFKEITLEKETTCNNQGIVTNFEDVVKNEGYMFGPNDSGLLTILKFMFENEKCNEIKILTIR